MKKYLGCIITASLFAILGVVVFICTKNIANLFVIETVGFFIVSTLIVYNALNYEPESNNDVQVLAYDRVKKGYYVKANTFKNDKDTNEIE